MPWCPNCKCEYRKGITLCADCNVELVDSLENAPDLSLLLLTAEAEGEETAIRFEKFLKYSNLPARLEKNVNGQFEVYTNPANFAEAKRCFQAFYAGESERAAMEAEERVLRNYNMELEDDEETDTDGTGIGVILKKGVAAERPKPFKSAVDRYEDYHSSAYAFSTVGALGIAFAVLNLIHVIPLFDTFPSVVLIAMFAVFFGFGVFSFTKLTELSAAAEKEKRQVADVKEWLKTHVNPETIGNYRSAARSGSTDYFGAEAEKDAGITYLRELELIQIDLLKAYPDFDAAYAEQLVDEYYNDTFTD